MGIGDPYISVPWNGWMSANSSLEVINKKAILLGGFAVFIQIYTIGGPGVGRVNNEVPYPNIINFIFPCNLFKENYELFMDRNHGYSTHRLLLMMFSRTPILSIIQFMGQEYPVYKENNNNYNYKKT